MSAPAAAASAKGATPPLSAPAAAAPAQEAMGTEDEAAEGGSAARVAAAPASSASVPFAAPAPALSSSLRASPALSRLSALAVISEDQEVSFQDESETKATANPLNEALRISLGVVENRLDEPAGLRRDASAPLLMRGRPSVLVDSESVAADASVDMYMHASVGSVQPTDDSAADWPELGSLADLDGELDGEQEQAAAPVDAVYDAVGLKDLSGFKESPHPHPNERPYPNVAQPTLMWHSPP